MPLQYATISGQILGLDGEVLSKVSVWIEATTTGGVLLDTVGNTVFSGRTRVAPDPSGNFTVTLPALPQADITPGDARYRMTFGTFGYPQSGTPSWPEPIEFTLTGDTTWDALVDVSAVDPSLSLVSQIEGLRDETVAAAGAVDYQQTRIELRPFYEQLAKRSTQRVKVMMLGDSIFEGAGVSPASTKRSIALMQSAIRARLGLPAGGFGYFPADYGALLGDETTRTGLVEDWNWTYGPGGKALKLTGHASTPGSVTWPAKTCTKIRIYYGKTSLAAGNFKVFIDGADVTNTGTLGGNGTSGAAGTSVSCVDAVSNSGGYYWESATLASASHTVEVRANQAGFVCPIVAAYFFDGDLSSGLHVIDSAHTGARTADFLLASMNPGWQEHATHAADLTLINIGTNDAADGVPAATYQANLTSIIAKVKAANPTGHICVVHGWRAGTTSGATWAAYADAERAVVDAEPLASRFDLEQLWPPLTTDGANNNGLMWEATNPIHLNTAGNQRLADILTDLLVAGGAPSGTGGGAPGADGADGSKWYSGTGAPPNGSYVVGDWYLNDANGDVYEKTGTSAWTLRDNLTGPTGPPGSGSGSKYGDRVMYVAAAGESATVKAACDYVCDGTADETEINAALAAVGSETISHGTGTTTPNTNGGKVVLVGRNFNISGAILVPTQTRLTSQYGEFATRVSCASSYVPGIDGGMIQLATANTQYVEIDGFTLDGNNVSTCGVYINVGTGQEYDAYIKVHDIYMWDIGQDGLSVNNQSGGRCRGNHFWSMRMINAGRYGVFINGPDSFYERIDVGSAGSHGFYIQHANNRLVNCKSWFSDGSGFYFTTASRDNQLTSCESQDNQFHGYHIQGSKNQFASCCADSNSYDGSPSGAITGRSYNGFHILGNYTNVHGTASDKNESSRGLRQVYGVSIGSGVTCIVNVTTFQHFTGSLSNSGSGSSIVNVVGT